MCSSDAVLTLNVVFLPGFAETHLQENGLAKDPAPPPVPVKNYLWLEDQLASEPPRLTCWARQVRRAHRDASS